MDHREVLPRNTVLDSKYRIERVLGAGGFGITYEATDIGLGMSVAVKEYYPSELAERDQSHTIRPRSEKQRHIFDHLRSSFLREAQTLAQFDDPAIVRVISVFPAHGTAYMVMRYEVGLSMKSWLNQLGRPPTQIELDQVLAHLLRALEVMHARDFLHRDIATDNIILRPDGYPVLLDFGSSRRVISHATGALTGVVKQGYSPPEQYSAEGKTQGPWTDIYAMGATLYRCVTGRMPPDGAVRMLEDDYVPAVQAAHGGYRQEFLEAIDWALLVYPKDRPQTIRDWRPALFAGTPMERSSFVDPSVQQIEGLDGDGSGHYSYRTTGERSQPPGARSTPSKPSARSSAPQALTPSLSTPNGTTGSSRPSFPRDQGGNPPAAAPVAGYTTSGTIVAPGAVASVGGTPSGGESRWGGRKALLAAGAATLLLPIGAMMIFGFPSSDPSRGLTQPASNARPSGTETGTPGATNGRADPALDRQALNPNPPLAGDRQRDEAERQKKADEQVNRLSVEAERIRTAEEARRKAAALAENARLAEEARKKAAADAERQRLAEIERQRLAELERQRLAELERQRAVEQAKRQAEVEAERLRVQEAARRQAAIDAERQRVADAERQRLLEVARRQAEIDAERQRIVDIERQRLADEARRQAELDAENKRLVEEQLADQRRRTVTLNASQTVEFYRQVQVLLKEHKCYNGDINGNEGAVRQAMELLGKHDASAPQFTLARSTVGTAQDALEWLQRRNRSICPGPSIEELAEQERIRKQQEDAQAKQREQQQKQQQKQQQQQRAQDEKARQQREAAAAAAAAQRAQDEKARQQREAAAAQREKQQASRPPPRNENNSGGGNSNGNSNRGNSGNPGGGNSPRVSVPSF